MMDELQSTPLPAGPTCDIYIAYADADEDVAKALQAELFRLRPGTRIWREKRRINAGDAFNQTADTAIAGAGLVLALWTPHSARTRAFAVEVRRALTLRKPFVNVLTGINQNSLAPPYAKYASFDASSIHRMAGRSTGWLPPMRPNRAEVEEDLKPLLGKIDELLSRADIASASEIADSMIANIGESAGTPHSTQFEAVMKSVAVGDPATAIEILGISNYSEAEINTLIAPQSVELADPTQPPPPWGAWRIVPQIVKVEEEDHSDNWLYAAAGFVAAALGAGILWLLASMLGGSADTASVAAELQPASGNGLVQPASAAATELNTCIIAPDGAISNTPCRVVENIAPIGFPTPEPGQSPLVPCDVASDGAITNTPCAMNSRYSPPPPDPTRFADLMETCQVAEDGAIANAPCALNAPVEAVRPEPVNIADLIDTCDVADDGAIANAPCRLVSPLTAPEPVTVEVPGETVVERVVEQVTIEDCVPARAGQTMAADCRLTREVTLAHPPCNETFSNLPCTASVEPRRITSAVVEPARRVVDLPPISVPDDLEPCEIAKRAPCRVTIAKTGLDTLTQLAEHYYGSANGYCRIFRANEDLFGTRIDPKRPGDPNCVYINDVISIPGPPTNGRFETAACPPARATNLCLAPN